MSTEQNIQSWNEEFSSYHKINRETARRLRAIFETTEASRRGHRARWGIPLITDGGDYGSGAIQKDQYEGIVVKRDTLPICANVGGKFGVELAPLTEINITPTPEEINTAPIAVQRVFKDIGIEPSDKASVQLAISRAWRDAMFRWSVKPEQMTYKRFGITLFANDWNKGGLAVPISHRNPTLLYMPFDTSAPRVYQEDGIDAPASQILGTYQSMPQPYADKITGEAGKWTADLIDKRKKPQASTPNINS